MDSNLGTLSASFVLVSKNQIAKFQNILLLQTGRSEHGVHKEHERFPSRGPNDGVIDWLKMSRWCALIPCHIKKMLWEHGMSAQAEAATMKEAANIKRTLHLFVCQALSHES